MNFCSRRPVGDATPALFSHQRGASHSEAATAKGLAMPRAGAVCSQAVVHLAPVRRLAQP
jgi:hypothetical protein